MIGVVWAEHEAGTNHEVLSGTGIWWVSGLKLNIPKQLYLPMAVSTTVENTGGNSSGDSWGSQRIAIRKPWARDWWNFMPERASEAEPCHVPEKSPEKHQVWRLGSCETSLNIMANLWPKFVDIQDHPKALWRNAAPKRWLIYSKPCRFFRDFLMVLSREWGNGMIVTCCYYGSFPYSLVSWYSSCFYGSFPYSLVSKFCEDAFRTIPSSWPKKSWRWWVSLPATSGSNWKPPVGCGTSWMTLERRWEVPRWDRWDSILGFNNLLNVGTVDSQCCWLNRHFGILDDSDIFWLCPNIG